MSLTTAAYQTVVAASPTSGAVASNDAANYQLGAGFRSVVVTNPHAAGGPNLLCAANTGTPPAPEASVTVADVSVPPGESADLCAPFGEYIRLVKDVSVYIDGTLVVGNEPIIRTLSAVN